jgi:hypothetical protein
MNFSFVFSFGVFPFVAVSVRAHFIISRFPTFVVDNTSRVRRPQWRFKITDDETIMS